MPRTESSVRLEYIREPDVSAALDRELIELISSCFDQPHNAFFRERRYAQEQPRHRYMLRSIGGQLVAHLGVHEKVLGVGGADVAVGGMAEVCVHPTERGHGYVHRLLEEAHRGLLERGVLFAILFGDSKIYGSSGYRPLSAPIARLDPSTQRVEIAPHPSALLRALADQPWPDGAVDLRGPLF